MGTAEFTTALLPLPKTWKAPWCPERDEWRRNMGYSHTMAYHSAGTKDAIQPFVTTRMAGRVLLEVKQAPGTKSNTVVFTYKEKKKQALTHMWRWTFD